MKLDLEEKESNQKNFNSLLKAKMVAVNEVVGLLIRQEWIMVIVDKRPVMGYRPSDLKTCKSVVVQLLNAELITVSEAIEAFEISRSTVYDAWRRFNQNGIEGLIPAKSGPKGPWKLLPPVRRLLLDIVYAHPNLQLSQITNLVNEQLQQQELPPLSQIHVRRFLTSCGISPKTDLVDLEQSPTKKSSAQTLTVEINNSSHKVGLTLAEQRYVKKLEEGIDSTFGGGFLTIPFLTLVQFKTLIINQLEELDSGYYSTLQISLTFFYLALFGLASLEMVKMIPKAELGVLIGKPRSPALNKLRSFLKEVAQLKQASTFALASASHQIQAGVVNWQLLFIDGHFMPYYGYHRIRKGYFTTHRMALKGHQAYYANDQVGRPLFFLLVEASISLTAILPEMVHSVQQVVGNLWREWCLTLVFDRGGFSAQLFKKLDEKKVHWVTWLKSSRKVSEQVYKIKEDEFNSYLLQLKKSQVKVKLYEWVVGVTDYGECRAIVLLDIKSQKRMVIITNDKKRSLSEIAEILLNRWSQENFFKVMLARYYLDYVPGHQFEQSPNDPQVDNPRIKELRQSKKRLTTMKRKLESELSQKLLARKREQVSLKSCKKAHEKRLRAIEALALEIKGVKDELAKTPKKIPLSEAWGEKHEITNLERKTFFDVIKVLAFNCEEWLLEELRPYYQAQDIRQALLQIIFRGAMIQLVQGVLYVRLKPFDRPKLQEAASALCVKLNSLKIITLDKFQFPIVYEVLPAR